MEILRGIEASALAARDLPGRPPGMDVGATEVDVVLPGAPRGIGDGAQPVDRSAPSPPLLPVNDRR